MTENNDQDSQSGGGEARLARPGGVTYMQIPAIDPRASGAFYAAVFGWRVHGSDAHLSFDDGALNVAARISALSAPGEILVSSTVRDLARTSAAVSFEDRGEHTLKGIEEPVRLYEVQWRE